MENMEKFMEKVVGSISHGRAQKSLNPVIRVLRKLRPSKTKT